MNQLEILQPAVAMLLLTGAVWLFMYARRLPFILANKIDPQSIATPELLNAKIPANINSPSNNLKNLFELPVVFYTTCAFIYLLQAADDVFIYLAWSYFVLRTIHSIVHCTVNIVNIRFTAYFLSSIILWCILARLALVVF